MAPNPRVPPLLFDSTQHGRPAYACCRARMSKVETALSQGIDPVSAGFSLVLKKNGRIGARSKGCPPWGTLVGDVERRKEAGMDTTNI